MPLRFERAGRTVSFDNGGEGTDRGNVEGLEREGEAAEKGGFAAEDEDGAES